MNKEMLAIASEEARKKISDQLSSIDATDQKIGILLGLVGVVLAVLFAQKTGNSMSLLFYLLGHLSLIVSFVVLLFAHQSIKLKTGLNIKGYTELIKKFSHNNDVITFLKYQLKYFEVAVASNNKLIDKKNTYLAYATVLLFLGLVFSMINCML